MPALLAAVPLFDGFSGGLFVAAGDLSGDGRAELVFAPDAGLLPLVIVFNPADGSVLPTLAYEAEFTGGVRLAVGDVDGDGRGDLVAAPGPGRAPTVKVFRAADGSLVQSFDAFDPAFTRARPAGAFVGLSL